MGVHDGHRSRMKERFRGHGLENFNDINALELLLFYAAPRRDTNGMAHALLERFGSFFAVLEANEQELLAVPGIGENAVTLLRLIPEGSRRYLLDKTPSNEPIDSAEAAGRYFIPRFMYETEETVYALLLDARKRPIRCAAISRGTVDAAEVNARRLAELALQYRASAVILAHNHPSGSPLPSRQDILVTQKLVHALAQIDIQLSDHIIIAGREYYSFADKHSHVNPMLSRETNGAADNYLGVVYLPEEDPAAHTE